MIRESWISAFSKMMVLAMLHHRKSALFKKHQISSCKKSMFQKALGSIMQKSTVSEVIDFDACPTCGIALFQDVPGDYSKTTWNPWFLEQESTWIPMVFTEFREYLPYTLDEPTVESMIGVGEEAEPAARCPPRQTSTWSHPRARKNVQHVLGKKQKVRPKAPRNFCGKGLMQPRAVGRNDAEEWREIARA